MTFKELDTDIIDRILKNNINPKKCFYMGCFAADKLPMPTRYPCCLVVNSDISTEAGTHWTCMYLSDYDSLEYFCPLGYTFYINPLFFYYIRVKLRCRNILFNLKQVQTSSGKACGYLCIEFLVKRSAGMSFSYILNNYTSNKMFNDLESEVFVTSLSNSFGQM